MASPIADLSYRSYDGPLLPPTMRWWVVAKSVMRLAIRKKGFWVWANLSYYWFIILAAVFYFVDVLAPTLPGGANPFFSRIVWKDQFLDAFSIAQMFLFIIALLIGAGAIANDNRSNALLVYLSKPCSKLDYLFGKWMAIFLILVAITGVPTLLFFVYGLLSYRHYGFISQDPALFWRLLVMIPVPAAFHASACLGISSLFNQGRMAGATYAGIYFLSLFFTKAMVVIQIIAMDGPRGDPSRVPSIVNTLFYASVDGLQIGLAKVILQTDGGHLLSGPGGPPVPPAPNGWLFTALYLLACGGFLAIAWQRVRAVEVVRG